MKLVEQFGLVSPNMQCIVHAGDGSLKRMANSKTMNVEVVRVSPIVSAGDEAFSTKW